MTPAKLFSLTVLSTLTLGLFSPPVAATDPEPDRFRTAALSAVANEFGDQNGQIRVVDQAGGEQVLAQGGRVYEVYTSGDDVYPGDGFAICSEDVAGGLSSCDELVAPPGGNEYWCSDEPDGDNWCECYDPWDCVKLALLGPCSGQMTCDGGVCYCS